MSSLLIDLIIGFWLLLFGALAIFPLMLDGKQVHRPSTAHAEDRVISIRPVIAPEVRRPRPITLDQDHEDDHPLHAA